jgi:hypothetical protein
VHGLCAYREAISFFPSITFTANTVPEKLRANAININENRLQSGMPEFNIADTG